MDEKDSVSLKVNGRHYRGWTNVSISAALLSLARAFTMSISRLKSAAGALDLGVAAGDEVEVYVGEDRVLTGFITKVSARYDKDGIELTVSGASRTWVLQSALPYEFARTFKEVSVDKAIKSIAGIFDVDFEIRSPLSDKITLSFSAEERIDQKLIDLAKRKSLIFTDDEKGRIVLSSAGTEAATDAIETGVNVLSGGRTVDATKRYREFVVYGQGTNPDSSRPVTDNQVSASHLDEEIPYRTQAVKQTGNAVYADCYARARAMFSVAKAESDTLSYTLRGWRQSDGSLWRVNQLVTVKDHIFNVTKRMVIRNIAYSLGAGGSTVQVDLIDPKAFTFAGAPSVDEKVKQQGNDYRLTSMGPVKGASWTQK